MTVRYASPQCEERIYKGQAVQTTTLDEAVHGLRAGDEVVLLPGVYNRPVTLRGVKGTSEEPIKIRGESATLDGERGHVRPPGLPEEHHYAFVKLIDCAHLNDLTLVDVWPSAVFMKDSHDVTLQRLNFHGATYAIAASGAKTRRLFIAHCSWIQDERIWQDVLWKDIHLRPLPRRELDGDFFRARDIAGQVVFYKNLVAQAFNGIHFFASSDPDKRPDPVNSDVWIVKNTFMFIRDNAVEAEFFAANWWVYQNRIYNCHKWFAFERCGGGYWYVFANTGWFDRLPGPPGDEFTGGAVIKGNKIKEDQEQTQLPSDPVYFFHNSWYLRSAYIKKGKLRRFAHFNNAIQYARVEDHPPGVVKHDRQMIGPDFTTQWTRLGIEFRDDVCDHRDYPESRLSSVWSECGSEVP